MDYSEGKNIKDNQIKNTKMVPVICSQCGGKIEVDPSQEMSVCEYCGTSFLVEKAIHNYEVQNARIEHVESVNINKRGAVESVFNFIEGQQNRKQQKIDEEKRRLEEERRIQEEKRKKTIDQIVNPKYRKRNLSILGVFVIVILIFSIIGATRETPSHEGEAKTPSGSSIQKGRDYKAVMNDFEDAGFVNIKTEILDDLITGWITKDGEVKSVSVDGDEDYSPDDWYPNDVEVIITYHTFPLDEEETTAAETTAAETTTAETTAAETTAAKTTAAESINSAELILEETFPREMARRAAVVAITNRDATDVFTDDGNAYDVSKFHSYGDRSGYYMTVYSDGTWRAKDDTAWHVDDIILEAPQYEHFLKLSLDVTYNGTNYVVSNVKGVAGALPYLDSDDPSKLDYIDENPSDFNVYLTVSPDLMGE